MREPAFSIKSGRSIGKAFVPFLSDLGGIVPPTLPSYTHACSGPSNGANMVCVQAFFGGDGPPFFVEWYFP